MNLKKLFSIFVVTIASVTLIATPAFADVKTNDVGVKIKSGGHELSVPGIYPFEDITLTEKPEVYETSFKSNFQVKDLTGMQEGWRLTVSSNKVSQVDGSYQLPVGSLTIDSLSNIARVGVGSGGLPTNRLLANTIIDDGAVTVAEAGIGAGMGVFSLTFPTKALNLVIDPTTAYVNKGNDTSYQTTLTWNLTLAP